MEGQERFSLKLPDRIVGHIEMQGTEYAFELDKDEYVLRLYSSKDDVQEPYFDAIRRMIASSKEEPKWLQATVLYASSADNHKVAICVLGEPKTWNGFLHYDVLWYVYARCSFDWQAIEGVSVYGGVVNWYRNPRFIFETRLGDGGRKLDAVTVDSHKAEETQCGSYMIEANITASVKAGSFPVVCGSREFYPLDARSVLVTSFSQPAGIELAVRAYENVEQFFRFVAYRNNLSFDQVFLFSYSDDGLRKNDAILAYRRDALPCDNHKRAKDCIITCEVIGEHAGQLIGAINDGELGLGHLPDSFSARSRYTPGRLITILADFENELRAAFGSSTIRSDDYIAARDEVVALIRQANDQNSGKKRKYYSEIANSVSKFGVGYSEKVRHALKRAEDVMEPFVKNAYPNVPFDDAIKAIGNRMNTVRNDYAHCNVGTRLEPSVARDIMIMEQLLYALRLMSIGVDALSIKHGIDVLYGRKLRL